MALAGCMGEIRQGMLGIICQMILKFVDTYGVVCDRTTNNKF